MTKLVLGIETSCDDTSVGILQKVPEGFPIVHFLKTYGQEESLEAWGGVVPEIAARNHLEKMTPLLKEAFEKTNLRPEDIDALAVTVVPGLLGPLLTGLNAAKTLAMIYKLPIVPVNHLYAHLEAIHIDQKINYPYLGLLVSGGHTLFMWVSASDKFEVLGSTIDDAAGEAFDKGGKMLGLGYPAGKIIDELSSLGDEKRFEFPIGLLSSKDARMSFSGIKTALRVHLEKYPEILTQKEKTQIFYDTVASYQEGIINNLVFKMKYAKEKVKEKYYLTRYPIVVGGGVACNSRLRTRLQEKYQDVSFVNPKYCADNGAMIAGYALRNLHNQVDYPESLFLDARGKFIDKKDFIR